MARPPRIEFAGAIYHVTSRADHKASIFADDTDRMDLLSVFAHAASRFDARALAFCLMDNHYHFVIRTAKPNLSRMMRHVNGVYTQMYNRRHNAAGHLFQGRFKAIIVDPNVFLLEACRYVDLNPVRSGKTSHPKRWPWCSYPVHTGRFQSPDWLDSQSVLSKLAGKPVRTQAEFKKAQKQYAQFVAQGRGIRLWESGLRSQIYLGNERFMRRTQSRAGTTHPDAPSLPRMARAASTRKLSSYLGAGKSRNIANRNLAVTKAYQQGGYTMTAIAESLGLSVSQISRIVKTVEMHRHQDPQ